MAKAQEKTEENEAKTNHYSTFVDGRGWVYGLLALIAVALVFIAGVSAANHHRDLVNGNDKFVAGAAGQREFGRRGIFLNGNGGSVTINGQTRTEGVVTSVNGSSFTIAGHGSTTNVTTSSSTQYEGGNSVKQNDTVVVSGTTSNGTLNATQVVINP